MDQTSIWKSNKEAIKQTKIMKKVMPYVFLGLTFLGVLYIFMKESFGYGFEEGKKEAYNQILFELAKKEVNGKISEDDFYEIVEKLDKQYITESVVNLDNYEFDKDPK